ncbi:hypothetical protein [Flagellimonas sp. 2504JD4-2]
MVYNIYSGGSTLPKTQPVKGGGTKSGSGGVLGAVGQISAVSQLLGGIVSAEVIGKTIGQALRDGWKCWGSTWTPTRAQNELPQWVAVIGEQFKNALNVDRNQLESSVNTFFKSFWGKSRVTGTTLENWIGWRYDSARDCTLKGLISLEKGVDAYLNQLESALKQIGPEINATVVVRRETITLYRTEAGGKKVNKPYRKSVPQIKVSIKPGVVGDVKELAGNKTVQFMGGSLLALAALGTLFVKSGNGYKRKSKSRKLY